jgi:hypothetical protein
MNNVLLMIAWEIQIRLFCIRLERIVNAADFPAPRAPQIRILPFRRRVFSALPKVLSIETILCGSEGESEINGEGSWISRPNEMV